MTSFSYFRLDAPLLHFVEDFVQKVSSGIYKAEDQHVFVIDDNMYYRSMRYEYFQLARKCKRTGYDFFVMSNTFVSIIWTTQQNIKNLNIIEIPASFPFICTDNAAFAQIYVKCPMSTAQHRNNKRSEAIPDHVIQNMAEKMEGPKRDNYWEKYSLQLDSSKDISKCEQYVTTCIM